MASMYMNNRTMSNGPTIVDASSISTISVKEAIDIMKNTKMLPIDNSSSASTITLNDTLNEVTELLNTMREDIISLKLRVYVLEDRISGEEAARLLQMYNSEDPDSRYLAEEIINKFEDNEYSI